MLAKSNTMPKKISETSGKNAKELNSNLKHTGRVDHVGIRIVLFY